MSSKKVVESIIKIVNTTVKRNGFDWLFEKVFISKSHHSKVFQILILVLKNLLIYVKNRNFIDTFFLSLINKYIYIYIFEKNFREYQGRILLNLCVIFYLSDFTLYIHENNI